MSWNCTICNKPIVLKPSAKERSEKFGLPIGYYKNKFSTHNECQLKKNRETVSALIKKL